MKTLLKRWKNELDVTERTVSKCLHGRRKIQKKENGYQLSQLPWPTVFKEGDEKCIIGVIGKFSGL